MPQRRPIPLLNSGSSLSPPSHSAPSGPNRPFFGKRCFSALGARPRRGPCQGPQAGTWQVPLPAPPASPSRAPPASNGVNSSACPTLNSSRGARGRRCFAYLVVLELKHLPTATRCRILVALFRSMRLKTRHESASTEPPPLGSPIKVLAKRQTCLQSQLFVQPTTHRPKDAHCKRHCRSQAPFE